MLIHIRKMIVEHRLGPDGFVPLNFPLATVRLNRTELFSAGSKEECATIWRQGSFFPLMAFSKLVAFFCHSGALSEAADGPSSQSN